MPKDKSDKLAANVRKEVSIQDIAANRHRREILDQIALLKLKKKQPGLDEETIEAIKKGRAKKMRFLREDAKKRGIPNDDH